MIHTFSATGAIERAGGFFLELMLVAFSVLIVAADSIAQEPSVKIGTGDRVVLRNGQSAL